MKIYYKNTMVYSGGVIDEKEFIKNKFKQEKEQNNTDDLKVVFSPLELNNKRNEELKGFIVNNILINEQILATMNSQYLVTPNLGNIEWIDINNKTVSFKKSEFLQILKKGSLKIKEIYFKYRQLKDNLKEIKNESTI